MYKVRTGFLTDTIFDTLEKAVNAVYYPNGERRFPSFEYRIWYAESCQLVEDHRIQQAVGNLRRAMHERQLGWIRKRLGPYEFRNGPVSHTGKKRARWHRGSYCRHPRTKQELTYGTRRNLNDLPTARDGYPRSRQRSWKKQRKTQWK